VRGGARLVRSGSERLQTVRCYAVKFGTSEELPVADSYSCNRATLDVTTNRPRANGQDRSSFLDTEKKLRQLGRFLHLSVPTLDLGFEPSERFVTIGVF
jgi:hypothetical protein